MRALFVCLLAITLPRSAHSQWSILSDYKALRGKQIVDVGTLHTERASLPGRNVYDPVLKISVYHPGDSVDYLLFSGAQSFCFAARSRTYSRAPAFVLEDASGTIYLAVLDPLLSQISVTVTEATPVECP